MDLESLAVQDDEVSILKVKGKQFYGVSFHPESSIKRRDHVGAFLADVKAAVSLLDA